MIVDISNDSGINVLNLCFVINVVTIHVILESGGGRVHTVNTSMVGKNFGCIKLFAFIICYDNSHSL